MKLIRYGKCATCQIPVKVNKEFMETVDMFNPTDKPVIRGELSEQIKAWRDEPLYCEEHNNG